MKVNIRLVASIRKYHMLRRFQYGRFSGDESMNNKRIPTRVRTPIDAMVVHFMEKKIAMKTMGIIRKARKAGFSPE